MSKIVRAANAIISNSEKVSSVCRGQLSQANNIGEELFFLYDGKYRWSIRLDPDGECWLFFHPGNKDISTLAAITDWDDRNTVGYSSTTLDTREAAQTFSELYRTVEEKLYGLDEVLDDIIEQNDLPF